MHLSLFTTFCPPIFWFAQPIYLTSLRRIAYGAGHPNLVTVRTKLGQSGQTFSCPNGPQIGIGLLFDSVSSSISSSLCLIFTLVFTHDCFRSFCARAGKNLRFLK